MEPVGQVIDPDGVTRRRSISNEWLIQDLLADVSPRSSTSPWGLSDEDLPPMPSRYTSSMNAHKGGEFSSAVEEYHVSLSRRETFLQDLFEDDPKFGWKEGENGQEGSGWIPERLLGEGFYGTVILWEKARRNGLPLQIATKYTPHTDPFFLNYKQGGHLIRRLNDIGCKTVVKLLDWTFIEDSFRMCFEVAELGSLATLQDWYLEHRLAFPESFIWHVFHSVVDFLCYCRYGSVKSKPRPKPGWDRIVHGDLKQGNVLLAALDLSQHQLYPSFKVTDFGSAYTLAESVPEVQPYKSTLRHGAIEYSAPEVLGSSRRGRKLQTRELHDSHSDVYNLGVMLAQMCKLAEKCLGNESMNKVATKSTGNRDNHIFTSYYSQHLKTLIRRLRATNPLKRPLIQDLYSETKREMDYQRAKAYTDTEGSVNHIFHDKVLYTATEQAIYEENTSFRSTYNDANTFPILEADKDVDPIVGFESDRPGSISMDDSADEGIPKDFAPRGYHWTETITVFSDSEPSKDESREPPHDRWERGQSSAKAISISSSSDDDEDSYSPTPEPRTPPRARREHAPSPPEIIIISSSPSSSESESESEPESEPESNGGATLGKRKRTADALDGEGRRERGVMGTSGGDGLGADKGLATFRRFVGRWTPW